MLLDLPMLNTVSDLKMAKPAKGIFTPKNPEKYRGPSEITYRSGWELQFMTYLDDHPFVLLWQSEGLSIRYKNPLTKRWASYIPDFLVVYMDKNNNKHVEVIEIKPAKETPMYENRVSYKTRLVQQINAAKWLAAMQYCNKMGFKFRIMTERELFGHKGN